MPNIGPMEILVVLALALVVFGPKRLPELGSSLGRSIREFKSSVANNDSLSSASPADAADVANSEVEVAKAGAEGPADGKT
jgi:sec-independent protein translocase protein TatA